MAESEKQKVVRKRSIFQTVLEATRKYNNRIDESRRKIFEFPQGKNVESEKPSENTKRNLSEETVNEKTPVTNCDRSLKNDQILAEKSFGSSHKPTDRNSEQYSSFSNDNYQKNSKSFTSNSYYEKPHDRDLDRYTDKSASHKFGSKFKKMDSNERAFSNCLDKKYIGSSQHSNFGGSQYRQNVHRHDMKSSFNSNHHDNFRNAGRRFLEKKSQETGTKESVNIIELSNLTHKRTVIGSSGSNDEVTPLKITFHNEDSVSKTDSDSSTVCMLNKVHASESFSDTSSKSLLGKEISTSCVLNQDPALKIISDSSLSTFNSSSEDPGSKEFFSVISSEEAFIPPPVSCPISNNPDASLGNLEKKEKFSAQNMTLDNVKLICCCSKEDDSNFSWPDSGHILSITNFIKAVVKEQSVPTGVADTVVRDLNFLFKYRFEGNTIDVYGSYYSGLAISTSDINLVMTTEVSVKKSFMYEVYKILSTELEKYHVHPFEEGTTAHKSKINFIHPATSISCQLAYLGSKKGPVLEMGKYLKRMCNRDERVKPLIIATKIWAEHLNINEVEDGKLHPVGFALLVIHFLQHCDDPILPILNYDEKEIDVLSPNDSSIGELWLQFLKYYSDTFDWVHDVVVVNSLQNVSKKSKSWNNYWIAIEDPFTEKNIAESIINSDVADFIKSCFKSSFMYFCCPPDASISSDNEENLSSGESCGSKYEFSFYNCMVDQGDTFCEMCDEIGDLCDECQKKLYVQPMASVPKMTDNFLKMIKRTLIQVYKEYVLTDEEVEHRKKFVEELEHKVNRKYPDAKLNLFGSSTNGFGFKKSDLDICLTFRTKVEKPQFILIGLRNLLRQDKRFDNVIAIFGAQIPILKFRFIPEGWHVDISLDNSLAVHNSQLLYAYSMIDERVKILGCALRLLAKKALVAEVTDKALSSYAYLIMVIHFLQQTDPPVLPVLQDNQFREKNFELDHIVDKCNVWFCSDINYVKKKFKMENDTPVEELFLDLLDYYCSFDCSQLITIRQKEIQPVKMRTSRLFNIQDPFIETKNLGCVVSSTKAQETKSVLNRARQLFRTPVKELPKGVINLEDYFFSAMSLTGRIVKEVTCDLCGKFGHEKNDCKHACFLLQRNFFNNKYFPRNVTYAKQSTTFRKSIRRFPQGQKL